jgi:amino acid permease
LIPNLIHDMRHPKQADRVVEIAYGLSMAVYLLVAVCGYLMYGTNVSDEVSGSVRSCTQCLWRFAKEGSQRNTYTSEM